MKAAVTCTVSLLNDNTVFWNVNSSVFRKLLKIFDGLETIYSGNHSIVRNETNGINIQINSDEKITCINHFVIKVMDNIIEYKYDRNYAVENELLRTIPKRLKNSVLPFIQNHN